MALSSADRMQLQVTLNGVLVEGLLHASVVTGNCFSSDSYALTFAMGSAPLCDIAFWSSLAPAYIEIVPVSQYYPLLQSLISGMIDTIVVDPVMQTVAIEGRDLSSTLIDSYRQQDFVNQTASEVVSSIALFHGLTPIVTPTLNEVGRYYGDGYTRLSLGQFSRLGSDWDLVVQLARENSFDVFVQDTSLFFQPSGSLEGLPAHIGLRDVRTIRFEQNLTLSSNVGARVQSWNSQDMASYAINSADNVADAIQAFEPSGIQPFLFSAANFTSQQVTDSAGRYAAELNRLGTVLHIEMPWDLSLAARAAVLIDETNSPLDAIYKIDTIERHYSSTSGSSQIIRAVHI
ncbi:hypothetical protein [Rhodopila sp.]|uniref:hypothetical protein n=1 Tax=Rhodopila sp. TaxID=2480087 RepID=UPI003D12AB73